jgi:hypothetical protein
MKLDRLKKLDLRSHWQHEALDFTRWLAEPENLGELSDEIGIGIEIIQTEANVGRFHVDILGQEENTGKKVIIENQLEGTDHAHLGQLITYAAGIEAEFIIWVVRSAREEHTQAIDWLNKHTDEKVNFFLVCVELWQIGDSLPAPKFTVLCRPNEWTKSVHSDTASQEGLTETKTMQLEFWQQLRAYGAEDFPELKLRNPRPQHWYDIAIGRSDCHIALTTNTKEDLLGAEIYIQSDKELFHTFYSAKDIIEQRLAISEPISWQELPEKKASRIRITKSFDFESGDRKQAFQWLLETARKMKSTFSSIEIEKSEQGALPNNLHAGIHPS